jgi:hypothetical protein
MKLGLGIFEQLSDLKNKFPKNWNIFFGNSKEVGNQYKELFGCDSGTLPFKYFGILIHYRKLKKWRMETGWWSIWG